MVTYRKVRSSLHSTTNLQDDMPAPAVECSGKLPCTSAAAQPSTPFQHVISTIEEKVAATQNLWLQQQKQEKVVAESEVAGR